MAATIRPYEPGDLDALYEICLRTGDAGQDASALLDDPHLLGHLYAAPYAALEPDFVFVAADDAGAAGYIVGTADTAAFEDRREAEWFPPLRARYPAGSGGDGIDGLFIALLHDPRRHDPDVVAEYPAHLHIDLLPRLQGQGLGRRLMEQFCTAVADRGAAGVHFGVSPRNQRALGFYAHLGFELVGDDGVNITLARRL